VRLARVLLALSLLTFPLLAASRFGSYTGVMAEVPFEFEVGNKIIPAGALLIRSSDARVDVLSSVYASENGPPSEQTALVFHRYGDRYFLTAIRVRGVAIVYELPESKGEAELKTHSAGEKILLSL
jgi:hypothetical protein